MFKVIVWDGIWRPIYISRLVSPELRDFVPTGTNRNEWLAAPWIIERIGYRAPTEADLGRSILLIAESKKSALEARLLFAGLQQELEEIARSRDLSGEFAARRRIDNGCRVLDRREEFESSGSVASRRTMVAASVALLVVMFSAGVVAPQFLTSRAADSKVPSDTKHLNIEPGATDLMKEDADLKAHKSAIKDLEERLVLVRAETEKLRVPIAADNGRSNHDLARPVVSIEQEFGSRFQKDTSPLADTSLNLDLNYLIRTGTAVRFGLHPDHRSLEVLIESAPFVGDDYFNGDVSFTALLLDENNQQIGHSLMTLKAVNTSSSSRFSRLSAPIWKLSVPTSRPEVMFLTLHHDSIQRAGVRPLPGTLLISVFGRK